MSVHHKESPQADRLTQASDGQPSDPIGIPCIAADSVLLRADDLAPVSDPSRFRRKQDLALGQPVPGGPRHPHQVRFWRWDGLDQGRPVWLGSVIFDNGVGPCCARGQVTHPIGPNIDGECDRIAHELRALRQAVSDQWDLGFHTRLTGHNGGDDLRRTDGRSAIVALADTGGPSVR